jgi:predicted DsbA family dithiol-disulfide isomerase
VSFVTANATVSVEIYSDVVCPWCYIGKRRFEAGLAEVADELAEAGVDVQVVYRPFQLDPTAPIGQPTPVAEAYARKFGGPERAAQIIEHVTSVAAESGIEFRMDRAVRANTLLAHRLLWFAEQHSDALQAALKERLLHAYFVDGLDIADHAVLVECAADAGFADAGSDGSAVEAFLASDRGLDEVRAQLDDGRERGVTAVPTYVFADTWAVPGAQEPETFATVLRKMAAKATAPRPA